VVVAASLLLGCVGSPESSPTFHELPAPVASIAPTSSELPLRTLPLRPASVPAPPIALTTPDGTHLRLSSLRAEASVQGPLAHTELHLVFDNPEDRTLQGRFTIDLPPGAVISRFAQKDGERWQDAEVMRRLSLLTHEGPLVRCRAPARLERDVGSRFGGHVASIPAQGRQELVVAFSHELTDSDQPYRLALRGLPPLDRFDAQILVDREVVEVHETGHAIDRDLEVPIPAPRRTVGLLHDGVAVARVAAPGSTFGAPITELTILFDTSASRALGFAGKVRRLGELVAALREQPGDFPLRVAAFDQEVALVYSGPASGFGEHELRQLWSRRPLGASDLGAALQWAVATNGAGRVLIATDGMPTVGRVDVEELTGTVHAAGFRIDAIVDHSPRDQPELEAITSAAMDEGVVVDGRLPAAMLAQKLLSGTLLPLQVEVEGSTWSWPRLVRKLQPGDEFVVYAQLPAGAKMKVVMKSPTTTVTEIPLVAVEGPRWRPAFAGARIAALQRERATLTDSRDRERLAWEIEELSLKEQVASEHTGFVAHPGTWTRPLSKSFDPDPVEASVPEEKAWKEHAGWLAAYGFGAGDREFFGFYPRHPCSSRDVEREQAETERTADSPHPGRRLDVTTALEAGRLAPALQLALDWRDRAPADVLALLALGEALERNGMPRAAARAYGSLMELHPEQVELRLHAGTRLEPLGDDALALAIDGYRHAIRLQQDGPPQLTPHRRLAYAQLRAGQPQAAWATLTAGLVQYDKHYGSGGEEGVKSLLREDLALVAAVWLRDEPQRRAEIIERAAVAGTSVAIGRSIRFESSAESDEQVSLHVYEGKGRRDDDGAAVLRWGGQPCPERLQSYGIACFVVLEPPQTQPYRLRVDHVLRTVSGPSDHGLATLQIVEHDGLGGLRFDHRPLLLMKEQASVELDVPARAFGPPPH
jgi:hypothetical protein